MQADNKFKSEQLKRTLDHECNEDHDVMKNSMSCTTNALFPTGFVD